MTFGNCDYCGELLSGSSHYHCPYCGKRCSSMGHSACLEKQEKLEAMQYESRTYNAAVYCGLRPGYDKKRESFPHGTAERVVQEFCNEHDLGATVTPTTFVYKSGIEPGVIVGLVNYPISPSTPSEIEEQAKTLARRLMGVLMQEQVTVVFPDHTLVIEDKGV